MYDCIQVCAPLRRVNIAVDAGVAERLAIEAKRQNKTLFALANECLNASLQVCENEANLPLIPELLMTRKFHNEMSLSPIPLSLIEFMVRRLYNGYRDDLLTSWRNTGREQATYFRMHASDLGSAASIAKHVWALKRLDILADGDGANKLELHSVGAGSSQEYSECWASSLSGFASRYGYASVKAEVSPGFVRLLLEKSEEPFSSEFSAIAVLQGHSLR